MHVVCSTKHPRVVWFRLVSVLSLLSLSPNTLILVFVQAAHLLGLSLLELGQPDDAGIIFERVRDGILGFQAKEGSAREACGVHRPIVAWDAAVNLAHSCCLSGRWRDAAVGYALCLKTSPMKISGLCCQPVVQSSRADLNNWLARALYGTKNIHGASRALAAAIHLRPNDNKFRFRSAIALLNKCLHIATCLSKEKSSTVNFALSSGDLTTESMHKTARVAREIFSWLREGQFHDPVCQIGAIVGVLVAKCDAVLRLAT